MSVSGDERPHCEHDSKRELRLGLRVAFFQRSFPRTFAECFRDIVAGFFRAIIDVVASRAEACLNEAKRSHDVPWVFA